MLVQNENLKNADLILRSNGAVVLGDANGVFDVPDEDGKFYLEAVGHPWLAYSGPYTPPTRSASPAGESEDQAALRDARAYIRELEAQLNIRQAKIDELEGRLGAAASGAPAKPTTGKEPPPENDEIDLEQVDTAGLHELAKTYKVKVTKNMSDAELRKALAAVMFE